MSLDDFGSFLDEEPDQEKKAPSSLDLDRLAAEQLPREQARSLEAEVMADPERANELKRRRLGTDAIDWVDTDALLGRIKAELGQPQAEATARPGFWARLFANQSVWMGLLATGAAAAVAVFALRPGAPGVAPLDPTSGVRAKGALRLQVFRQKGEGAELMASGATFRAGDTLGFKVDAPGAGVIHVLGVDAAGALYTAWPLPDHVDAPTHLGGPVNNHALPGAVELDDAPGPETLYLVHCPPGADPTCTVASAGIRCPEGCATTPFTLEKAP
jgi:hypothetical protein